MTNFRRVVVTGIGVVSPVGLDVDSTWKNLLAGTPGVARIQRFDTTNQQVKIAGELKDFDPKKYMDHKMARRSGRFAQMAVAASKQALCSGNLEVDESNRDEIGVVVALLHPFFPPPSDPLPRAAPPSLASSCRTTLSINP